MARCARPPPYTPSGRSLNACCHPCHLCGAPVRRLLWHLIVCPVVRRFAARFPAARVAFEADSGGGVVAASARVKSVGRAQGLDGGRACRSVGAPKRSQQPPFHGCDCAPAFASSRATTQQCARCWAAGVKLPPSAVPDPVTSGTIFSECRRCGGGRSGFGLPPLYSLHTRMGDSVPLAAQPTLGRLR